MKGKLGWLLKALLAFVLAFAIVSGFSFFYYNLPIHFTNQSGATDYVWEENHLSIRGTEGYACTYTDENGFVNTFPHKKDTVDVLIMGSSHGEAFNVGAEENFTYRLNQKLYDSQQDMYAYSICTSGHTLLQNFSNLEAAIKTYAPSKYIVLETYSVSFSNEQWKSVAEGTLQRMPSYDSGWIYYLQQSDYFRLIAAQLSNAMEADTPAGEPKPQDLAEYAAYLEQILAKAGKVAAEAGCELIIMDAPSLEIDYSGNVLPQKEAQQRALFQEICQKNGITYLNVFGAFAEGYRQTQHLPHGFSNTAVGVGHTNRYGHEWIAEELYQYIHKQGG